MAMVLVVDDEASIVDLVALVLKQNGHSVLTASGAVEAIMVCSSCRPQVDLVVTDVVMPGMNGVELAARLRALDPTVRILLMSGSVPDHIHVPKDLQLLEKPFLPQALIEVVTQVLQC